MDKVAQRQAAKQFVEDWQGRGDEKQDAQNFWRQLLQKVYDVGDPEKAISFEYPVKNSLAKSTIFVDAYIHDTRVLIEQKGIDIDLKRGYKQSDGSMLTPYQQARRYAGLMDYDMVPRWIVVSNFREFHIHDMMHPNADPEILQLADLEKEYYRLNFLVNPEDEPGKKEKEVSFKAGELVGKLYDAFYKQYKDPESERAQRSLNELCVRLVFCLYAEDADIFGKRLMFHDYLQHKGVGNARDALIKLFKVLDQKPEERDPYLDDELAAFPYVNGGLFSDENIEIPRITEEIYHLILRDASEDFDWSEISPTIFGAVFESTLNPETRRKGGIHYTSIENIHKVIDPLFLNELKQEFEEIKSIPVLKTRNQKLGAFHGKLASLTFLDPAAGSGNFLTETYLSLRRLENELILLQQGGQISIGEALNPIKISISQFYGIEINDFAVTVAKTALWIAESQMMKETEIIVHMPLDFLPLKTNATIIKGNALRTDWESIVPKTVLSYIISNPPFVGSSYQTKEQKADLALVCPECGKSIDYVTGWYYQAARLMKGTKIRTALVSTNSITQGEQVALIWKELIEKIGIEIDFAHRTFRWDSEASLMAHVHCVIVGFSDKEIKGKPKKTLYESGRGREVDNINPYLLDAPTVFIERRTNPLCEVPSFVRGCQPTDDGKLILTEEEREELLASEPQAAQFIRPFMMGKDFIQRKPRYCIWLLGANPSDLQKCPKVLERVQQVREYRLKSPKAATRAKSETPTLFDEIREPKTDYVGFPTVSSEQRKYVPIDYLSADIIPGNKIYFMENASLFHFGVITSNVHMAWMRATCGRMKSDYNYSNTIVYNNFPWPEPTAAQRAKIEVTAQGILDARALYPDSSLADLYKEIIMPPELRTAHQKNDRAVMEAYGMSIKDTTESSCVAELMRQYQEKTK